MPEIYTIDQQRSKDLMVQRFGNESVGFNLESLRNRTSQTI